MIFLIDAKLDFIFSDRDGQKICSWEDVEGADGSRWEFAASTVSYCHFWAYIELMIGLCPWRRSRHFG